jgi:thiamine pyrophosphate-dependent acetolactate synthase large subunit-like protein
MWMTLFVLAILPPGCSLPLDAHSPSQSYGIESFRCETLADLPAAVDRFVNAKGPILVDFGVVPDICLPMVAPGKGLDEMFMPGDISLDDEVHRP